MIDSLIPKIIKFWEHIKKNKSRYKIKKIFHEAIIHKKLSKLQIHKIVNM